MAETPLGETLASSVPRRQAFAVREPIGVVAGDVRFRFVIDNSTLSA